MRIMKEQLATSCLCFDKWRGYSILYAPKTLLARLAHDRLSLTVILFKLESKCCNSEVRSTHGIAHSKFIAVSMKNLSFTRIPCDLIHSPNIRWFMALTQRTSNTSTPSLIAWLAINHDSPTT